MIQGEKGARWTTRGTKGMKGEPGMAAVAVIAASVSAAFSSGMTKWASTNLFTSLKVQRWKMQNKIWSLLVLINREWTPGTIASLPTQKDASGDHSHGRLSCCFPYLTSLLRKTAQEVCKSQTGQKHDTTAASINRTKIIVQQYSLNMERFIQNTRFVNSKGETIECDRSVFLLYMLESK